jgi:cytoskeletal protein CcmA (bactofilin family)
MLKHKIRKVFMKKKFIFGMIALLSVSLFFLGCPTEASDDDTSGAPFLPPDEGGSPPSSADQAKALAQTLTSLGLTVTLSGSTLTIVGSESLNKPLIVPAGVTLAAQVGETLTVEALITVAAGATLSVPAGATLTVDGTNNGELTVAGTLSNPGTLTVDGPLTVTGTITNAGTGTITVTDTAVIANGANAGTVTIDGGGTLTVTGALTNTGAATLAVDDGTLKVTGAINNTGAISIAATGILNGGVNLTGAGLTKVAENGTVCWNVDDAVPLVGATTEGIFVPSAAASFSFNNTQFVLDGEVTLEIDYSFDAAVRQLIINYDGSLVTDGVTLTISNPPNPVVRYAIVAGADPGGGANAPKIDLNVVGSGIDLDIGASNFYLDSANAAEVPVTTKTYTWNDTNAGGNAGTVGWERT